MTTTPDALPVDAIRDKFPALERTEGDHRAAYLDGPGGTQVPESVIEAMSDVLSDGVSNVGGGYGPSDDAVRIMDEGRLAMADLFNATPAEIAFGQNMTSLTFAISRAISKGWKEGEAVVLTSLDHDANFTPWVRAAEESGVEVRIAEFDAETGLLDPASVIDLIDEKVRLVAVCLAANSIGSLVDVAPISEAAHEAGSLVYVDAVHATPHRLIDVQQLGADFLVASAYKFFGPHTGILYGRRDLLAGLAAYKVRPAPSDPPEKWETGTQSFESIAGVTAAVNYLADLGGESTHRRNALEASYSRIQARETQLARLFVDGLSALSAVRLHGVQEHDGQRVSTFAVEVAGNHPTEVAKALRAQGIYVVSGHYYALNVMDRLGLGDSGGLVRIGFVHYNTESEVERTLDLLGTL